MYIVYLCLCNHCVAADDEVPSVQDCPLYLEVIEDFSKNNTVPVSWTEPRFLDNTGVTQVAKTMVCVHIMITYGFECFYLRVLIVLGTWSAYGPGTV